MTAKIKLDNIKAIAPYAMALSTGNNKPMERFIFPCRPELQAAPATLDDYDTGKYLAQPKLNGSNILVYLSQTETKVYERHGKPKTGTLPDFSKLHKGEGIMILNGEYMEKSKKDAAGENFNGRFIIFDILAYDGLILTGSTFMNRLLLLHTLFYGGMHITDTGKLITSDEYISATGYDNIYLINSFKNHFKTLYNQVAEIDMYEGIVLKALTGMLQPPFSEKANAAGQLKSRKATKNYSY